MKNHEQAMSIRESARLAELEQTIERGRQTFVEVGLALTEIRDLRLYKREYSSFSEYCQKKWGWEKAYANHVIRAADVVKGLPAETATMVANERIARELAQVEPSSRAGVVQAIVDEGKPVTAAEIKRHLPPPPMRPTNALPSPPPTQVLDGTGWPIPTQLIPRWLRAHEVQEMLTTMSRVKGVLRRAQDDRDVLYAEVNFSSALSHLDQVWADVKTAKPFAVCPACQGQVPDKCSLCHGRGLISEHRWNTCVTREDKEFRIRANAARN